MAYQASLKALEASQSNRRCIRSYYCCDNERTNAFPSATCELQSMLKLTSIPAFDVGAACAGFSYALSIADQFIRAGQAQRVLVVGADVLSKMCDPDDRGTIILFGDGAGAVILEASEEAGILSTHIHADGQYGDLLKLPQAQRGQQISRFSLYAHERQ